MKMCVFDSDKICDECGDCDELCDLDPTKVCDNCMRCLHLEEADYRSILIDEIFERDEEMPDEYR
ncbi:MAG: hypothetical protein ACOYI8_08210 [Christensenellales bacterium]|jgi:hypothetical protein